MTLSKVAEVNCCNTYFEHEPQKNVCSSFSGKTNAVDKTFKALAALSRANDAALAMSSASPELREGFKTITHNIETTRSVMAFFNVFNGSFQGTIKNVKNLVALVRSKEGQPVSYYNVNLGETLTYTTFTEKLLAGVSEVGNFIGGATYIIGFGVLSPIMVVDKAFKNQINESASKVGKQFGFVMMINHFGVVMSVICDMIRETMVDWTKSTVAYAERMGKLIMIFIEKGCEIAIDCNKFFGVQMPQGAILGLNIVLSFVSVTRVWKNVNTSVARVHNKAHGKT
jgi:hypothetical protein